MSRHFSREALLRLLRGPASEAEAARALRHAVECRRCRSRAAGWLAREKTFRPADPRQALVAVLEEELSGSVEALRARSWWAEIKDLSPEGQIRKIRSTQALQSLPVFEAILAEATSGAVQASLRHPADALRMPLPARGARQGRGAVRGGDRRDLPGGGGLQ